MGNKMKQQTIIILFLLSVFAYASTDKIAGWQSVRIEVPANERQMIISVTSDNEMLLSVCLEINGRQLCVPPEDMADILDPHLNTILVAYGQYNPSNETPYDRPYQFIRIHYGPSLGRDKHDRRQFRYVEYLFTDTQYQKRQINDGPIPDHREQQSPYDPYGFYWGDDTNSPAETQNDPSDL